MAAVESAEWYAALTEEERSRCAEELTDAYFAALTSNAWEQFQTCTQEWMHRAAERQLITA